jgi:hypothetical protein
MLTSGSKGGRDSSVRRDAGSPAIWASSCEQRRANSQTGRAVPILGLTAGASAFASRLREAGAPTLKAREHDNAPSHLTQPLRS